MPRFAKIYPLAFALALVFLAAFCLKSPTKAQAAAEEEEELYYIFNLFYDKTSNQIALNIDPRDNNVPIRVGVLDATNDSGANSQFYAKVKDTSGMEKKFKDEENRYYLGEWRLETHWDGVDSTGKPIAGTIEKDQGTVLISVPYFPNGQVVEIYDTRNDKKVLSINVEAYSQEEMKKNQEIQATLAGRLAEEKEKQETEQEEGGVFGFLSRKSSEDVSVENQQPQSSSAWLVVGIIAIALFLTGLVIWLVRRNKEEDTKETPPPTK